MSNLWINIRFGTRHLQVGRDEFSFRVNSYHVAHPPRKWFEVYEFFGWHV